MTRDAADVQHELDRFRQDVAEAVAEAVKRIADLERRLARQCSDCGRVPQDPTEDHGCGQ